MLPMIMAGMALGSSLLSGYASYRSSKEQEAVAKYNAAVARNRGIAEKQAIEAQNRIQMEVDRANMSTLENAMANRGIATEIGSPLLVATKELADMVADRSEMNRQAQIAYMTGEAQSTMYRRQAKSIKSARTISLLAQGMQGATSTAGAYASYGGTWKGEKLIS